jgi:hypothetical protein
VDLSYPAGKPYARGCFLYPALEARTSRLAPLESSVAGFVLASPSTRRLGAPRGPAHLTETMASYRHHLERLATRTAARIVQEPGLGLPLTLPGQDALPRPREPKLSGRDRPVGGASVADVLAAYSRDLEDVPPARGPFPAYLESLGQRQRETLSTLLPVMASRRATASSRGFAEILADTRLAVIAAVAESIHGPPLDAF